MKKLKDLKGTKELNRTEQKAVKGGKMKCLWGETGEYCPFPYVCINGTCVISPL